MAVDTQRQSLMQDDRTRLTFDGKLALAGVTPRAERDVRFSSLAGARVRVRVPASWDFRGIAAHVIFDHSRDGDMSFQRHPRGSSLINLLGEADRIYPDSLINMGGGKLAHYKLDWGPEAVSSFTLWQGPWSDVFTSSYETFDQALDAFRLFVPQDAPDGAVLAPPIGWKPRREGVTVEWGALLLEVEKRNEGTLPAWPGARGAHVDLYRMEDEETGAVLAVSPTAMAVIERVTAHEPVTDHEVAELAEGLDLEWA